MISDLDTIAEKKKNYILKYDVIYKLEELICWEWVV